MTSNAGVHNGKLSKKIDSNGIAHSVNYKLLNDEELHQITEHKPLPYIETALPTLAVSKVVTHDPLGDQEVRYTYKNYRVDK